MHGDQLLHSQLWPGWCRNVLPLAYHVTSLPPPLPTHTPHLSSGFMSSTILAVYVPEQIKQFLMPGPCSVRSSCIAESWEEFTFVIVLSNALWLVAVTYYFYITFLGYFGKSYRKIVKVAGNKIKLHVTYFGRLRLYIIDHPSNGSTLRHIRSILSVNAGGYIINYSQKKREKK